MIEQFAIAATGVTAIWLTQSLSPKTQRYACLFGLAGQPFWFWAAISASQWGIVLLCCFYTVAWARGVWTHWLAASTTSDSGGLGREDAATDGVPAADGVTDALRVAEAALADIGDADREPGDDIAWAEKRAAKALPAVRAALTRAQTVEGEQDDVVGEAGMQHAMDKFLRGDGTTPHHGGDAASA